MPSYVNGQNPADITLTLSRRLITVVRVKNILHIEAGLEMIALAMAISSEVIYLKIIGVNDIHPRIRTMGFFPEMACDVRNIHNIEYYKELVRSNGTASVQGTGK